MVFVKKKQKVDIIIALFLILIGVILLLLPLFDFNDVRLLITIVFSLYTILNGLQFIITKESKDFEGLYSALASLVVLFINIFFDVIEKPKSLALLLLLWISLMAIVKLKKTDYYHDRKDRMWKLRIFNLGLFILTGFLTSINLAYSSDVQIIVIGFFMLIHGILELVDPITKILISRN